MPQDKKTPSLDFEKSLAELEKIVQRMEQGEQSLEQTLKDFERGMVLSKQCQDGLAAAQQKVEKLIEKHGGYELEDFIDEEVDDKNEDDEHGDDKSGDRDDEGEG